MCIHLLGSVPRTLQVHSLQWSLIASPKKPSTHLSQLKPSVSKRHLRHWPVCGSQLPVSRLFQLEEQSHGLQLPVGSSGSPWKLSAQMSHLVDSMVDILSWISLTSLPISCISFITLTYGLHGHIIQVTCFSITMSTSS